MQVKDVMVPEVKTIAPAATIRQAAQVMKQFHIGSLIVVDKAKLAGIVTDRDILEKVVAPGSVAAKVKVADIMTKKVVMIAPDADVEEAAEVMVARKIKKLPVVEDNSLVGIVTATDICASEPRLMEQISELFQVGKKKVMAG
ncbi:MAG: CBS domain-containing protein [Candidatus Aenigmarchaeota archaeon]|nr:CBS domain-containing protein [Candidatus Aenigmarchaeota archaeon]